MDKDLDFDLGKLNEIFELLKLESSFDRLETSHNLENKSESNHFVESGNRDFAEEIVSCEKKLQKLDLNNKNENYFEKNIKTENDENISSGKVPIQVSLNENKVTLTHIKEEIENHFIKFTDFSSSDDENYATLVARGKEKHKRRVRKETVYERRVTVSPTAAVDIPKLNHCGKSDSIQGNTSNYSLIQTSSPSKFPQYELGGSPESGYGSPLQPIVSPSPHNSLLPFGYENNEEGRKKLELIYSLMEAETQFREVKQNSIIIDSNLDDNEQRVEKRYDPSDSVKTNTSGNLKNKYTSLADGFNDLLITDSFQVPGEISDELWNSKCNDLYNSIFKPSISEATVHSLENSKDIAGKYPVLCYRTVRPVESSHQKISYQIKDYAKIALRNSGCFDVEKYTEELKKILTKIKHQEKSKEKVQIIDYDERELCKNLNQTILHSAVLESNVEKVLCIIEVLKRYNLSFFNINNRDANKRTALDYAIKKNMPLLINYLKENNAVPSIIV